MANQAVLRQIAQLRAQVRALKERHTGVPPPAPDADTIREVLQLLIDLGAITFDGESIEWKGPTVEDERRRDHPRRERERGLA